MAFACRRFGHFTKSKITFENVRQAYSLLLNHYNISELRFEIPHDVIAWWHENRDIVNQPPDDLDAPILPAIRESILRPNFNDITCRKHRDEIKAFLKMTKSPRAMSEARRNKFFESDAWRELRSRVFSCYGEVCMKCGVSGKKVKMQVDHIQPLHSHPELRLRFDNLQVLCADCNCTKGALHSTDYRKLPEPE